MRTADEARVALPGRCCCTGLTRKEVSIKISSRRSRSVVGTMSATVGLCDADQRCKLGFPSLERGTHLVGIKKLKSLCRGVSRPHVTLGKRYAPSTVRSYIGSFPRHGGCVCCLAFIFCSSCWCLGVSACSNPSERLRGVGAPASRPLPGIFRLLLIFTLALMMRLP